jgi:hypothetical protein
MKACSRMYLHLVTRPSISEACCSAELCYAYLRTFDCSSSLALCTGYRIPSELTRQQVGSADMTVRRSTTLSLNNGTPSGSTNGNCSPMQDCVLILPTEARPVIPPIFEAIECCRCSTRPVWYTSSLVLPTTQRDRMHMSGDPDTRVNQPEAPQNTTRAIKCNSAR